MKILLMGRKWVSATLLEDLLERGHNIVAVVTDSHLEGSVTTAKAKKNGIRTLGLEEVSSLIAASELEFDLGLSVVYWRRIPKAVIDSAPRGIINFHPAPLPEYKGTAGYNLAILEGLTRWAVTAHYIDEDIDTGAIIDTEWIDVDADAETAQTLEGRSMRALLELARRTIARLEVSPEPLLETTPNIGGRYVSRAEMEAMKEIQPGDDVARKVRAFWFPPYRGATISIDGKKYTLVSDELLQDLADPGATNLNSHNAFESS